VKIRFTIAVGLIALGLLWAAPPVRAQAPVATPTPLPPGTPTGIPEQVPANWSAQGMTQGEWTALRHHCLDIFALMNRGQHLPPGQHLNSPHYSFREREDCMNLSQEFTVPYPPGPTPAPTIVPAPLPFLPPPTTRSASPQS